jgi:hypothetical protein
MAGIFYCPRVMADPEPSGGWAAPILQQRPRRSKSWDFLVWRLPRAAPGTQKVIFITFCPTLIKRVYSIGKFIQCAVKIKIAAP